MAACRSRPLRTRRRSRRPRSSPRPRRRPTSSSRWASRSSGAGPPGWPAPCGSRSCSRAIPRSPSGSARCRSRSSTRAGPSARISSRAPSSSRRRCSSSSRESPLAEMTSYGPVEREAVYFMTRSRAARLPIVPPPMHNKGNHVFSLARLARFMAEQAEELGVMLLPETDAQRLLVDDGAVRGIRTGDKGRGPPGRGAADVRARRRADSPGDGAGRRRAGHALVGGRRALRPAGREPADLRARRQGGLARRAPARPRRAHARVAAQAAGALPRVRRHVRLPDGPRHALSRARRRPRLRRRLALGARPAAGGQVPPALPAGCSRAASASPGARRRSPRAASGRCPRASPRRAP